jgi:hypothetical protein
MDGRLRCRATLDNADYVNEFYYLRTWDKLVWVYKLRAFFVLYFPRPMPKAQRADLGFSKSYSDIVVPLAWCGGVGLAI